MEKILNKIIYSGTPSADHNTNQSINKLNKIQMTPQLTNAPSNPNGVLGTNNMS